MRETARRDQAANTAGVSAGAPLPEYEDTGELLPDGTNSAPRQPVLGAPA